MSMWEIGVCVVNCFLSAILGITRTVNLNARTRLCRRNKIAARIRARSTGRETVCSGKGSKVRIEGVIFLEYDYDMLNLAL